MPTFIANVVIPATYNVEIEVEADFAADALAIAFDKATTMRPDEVTNPHIHFEDAEVLTVDKKVEIQQEESTYVFRYRVPAHFYTSVTVTAKGIREAEVLAEQELYKEGITDPTKPEVFWEDATLVNLERH